MDQDIQAKVQAAIKAGAPRDEAIQRGMALQAQRAPQKGMDIQNPGFSGSQPQPEPKGGILQSIGKGVVGMGKSLLSPFKGLAADAYDLGKFTFGGGEKAFGPQYQNPFRKEEDLVKTRNQDDLGGFALDQAKKTAGIMSFAVPFGKAGGLAKVPFSKAAVNIPGFVGSKFVAPGAAAGAMHEASQDDATLESTLGAGLVGAGTGAVMQGAGKIIKGVKTGSKTAKEAASTIEQGTRQIKQKASIYGAGNEKAINKTLDKYKHNFKGDAQKQYEGLEPTMNEIEGKIQQVIKDNPSIVAPVKDIKLSFLNKLKSALRSKDMTQKQALDEVNGYLKDLIKASGGRGKFTEINLERLRHLKKLVNEDYGAVHEIIERGGSLTPRQKVIEVAWQSLDDAVKSASPEIKELLLDESNLYKAAQSLSTARSNPPTFRLAGTSVPAWATQKMRDAASTALRTVGDMGEKVTGVVPNLPSSVVGQTGVRLVTEGLSNKQEQGQNAYDDAEGDQGIQDTSNFTTDNAQSKMDSAPTITGRTVEQHMRALSKASAAGDKGAVAAIKAQLTIEQAYQKTRGTDSVKPLSGPNSVLFNKAQTAVKAVDRISQVLKGNPTINIEKALNPTSQEGRLYGADVASTIDILGYFRTGAAITADQRQDYIYMLPGPLDDAKTARTKMERLKEELQGYADGLNASRGATPDPLEQTMGGFSGQQSFNSPSSGANTKIIAAVPQNAKQSAQKNLPLIEAALKEEGINDPQTLAYALATIEHETAGTFEPIEEYGGRSQARRLGYGGGENYFGRGFIQLTHAENYQKIGQRIGVGDALVKNPQLALRPDISAKILAAFFKDRGVAAATSKGDFIAARRPVNGTDQAREIASIANRYLRALS